MEVAHRDYISRYLEQMLMQNNKLFCFRKAWEKLEKAIEHCDDHVDCRKILHYDLLKNEFKAIHALPELQGILREKLTNFSSDSLRSAKNCTSLKTMDLGTHTAVRMTACKTGRCHFQNTCAWWSCRNN